MLEGMPADALPAPLHPDGPYRICCVCLGNICRSPMAEVVLRDEVAQAGLAGRVVIDSAGTGDWHVGERMHRQARSELRSGGYEGDAHRARQFEASWLPGRDLILAMDASNLAGLQRMAEKADAGQGTPGQAAGRIRLFGELAGLGAVDVPDPYGQDQAEFGRVLAMLKRGAAAIVAQLPQALTQDR